MSDWKSLAIQEANRQNCPVDIVFATVEAETGGRNTTGDNGHALGYGQVWSKWHMDAFEYAAQLLGLPTPPSDLTSLTNYTLANDQFSMAVAVRVIKQYWDSAQGVWANFTYSYVGPGISVSDFKRRENIWIKYHNSSFDYTDQAAFMGAGNGLVIPATNYGIVPGSAQSGEILYGRRYRVIVSSLDGEKAVDVSQLRCTFNCVKIIQMQPQFSEIVIYNLSAQTENAIIKEGDRVVVEAGYEGKQYGLIFDGNVVQVIRNKEGGTTYTLTLVAADSDVFLNYSLSAFSMIRGQNSRAVVDNLTNKATISTQLGNISATLSDSALTRGKVFFGLTRDYLRQIAQSENATYYMEDGKVNIIRAEDIPEGEIIELSPESGLIGVPEQSDFGVKIKCLLNPRIKINSLVHVDNSLIRNQQFDQGQPISLDHDGIYRAIKVTHIGDSRGNDWYTEIETVTQSGILPAMVANGGQVPW
ncbi:hypothetical protein JCM15765_03980 [Paradesulfitobacterium aromaticivorans]